MIEWAAKCIAWLTWTVWDASKRGQHQMLWCFVMEELKNGTKSSTQLETIS